MTCINGEICVKVNIGEPVLKTSIIVGIDTKRLAFPERFRQVCIFDEICASARIAGDMVNWVIFDGD